MRAVLLIVVLTSVCVLLAGADIPIHPDFDVQQFYGKWYPIALVMDRGQQKNIEVHDNVAQPADDGNVLLEVHFYQNGVCGTNELTLMHTSEPGKFIIGGGVSTMRIVEIDYGRYYILHVAAGNTNILHLYGRQPHVSDDVTEKFKNRVTSLQFPVDKIHYETRTGNCS